MRLGGSQGDKGRRGVGSWGALGQRATLVRHTLAEAHDTRCQWEAMTEPTRAAGPGSRHRAKRRGVLSRDDHLRSAEPEGFIYPQREHGREVWVQPRLGWQCRTSPRA
jgi:hypothetical protein